MRLGARLYWRMVSMISKKRSYGDFDHKKCATKKIIINKKLRKADKKWIKKFAKEDYLEEVQVLRPTRKQLKNQRSQLIFKLNRTQQQLNTANQKMRFT